MKSDKQAHRKEKAKAKLLERRQQLLETARTGKADWHFQEAMWFANRQQYPKALVSLEKAMRYTPDDLRLLRLMLFLSTELKRPSLGLKAMDRLFRLGQLSASDHAVYAARLIQHKRLPEALAVSEKGLALLAGSRHKGVGTQRRNIQELIDFCRARLAPVAAVEAIAAPVAPPVAPAPPEATRPVPPAIPVRPVQPRIPVTVALDRTAFVEALVRGRLADAAAYDLCLEAHRIRFRESFESLICLAGLHNIRSLWYQEETARKVLRDFRGRALLSDEVGLGKTIEAGIILKEYILRGMVKTVLILTPTPLVSQWQEELRTKFDLALPSTDDAGFRNQGDAFWDAPMLLASINVAKSGRHFDVVCRREYDLVIVDEAHHLKSRSTLNWKLVSALKKRFLLLLTATPVENNLMELYNLITILKPGQLKTPGEFKAEFMTRGDPTAPQNRTRLKQLLNQVMIRNTRALARINLPPRYAVTVRVEPSAHERELYRRVSDLVCGLDARGGGKKMLLKTLLAEAGSSPPAVAKTVAAMMADPEMPAQWKQEAGAIVNLTRSMADTRKNEILADLLRTMPGKMIIFVKYTATLEHVDTFLDWRRIPHALFHGGLDNAAKDRQIQLFRDERDILVTTEIGGEGRNLQFCHQMINYDLPWNPMRIEQRIGRIHRIGQEKEVQIRNLCAVGSAEDYILEILDRKINMFEMVIGEIDMILGRIRGEAEFSELVYEIWVNATTREARDRDFGRLADELLRNKQSYLKSRILDDRLFGESYEI